MGSVSILWGIHRSRFRMKFEKLRAYGLSACLHFGPGGAPICPSER